MVEDKYVHYRHIGRLILLICIFQYCPIFLIEHFSFFVLIFNLLDELAHHESLTVFFFFKIEYQSRLYYLSTNHTL